ncbi:MAG: TolB family protein [bacterium]
MRYVFLFIFIIALACCNDKVTDVYDIDSEKQYLSLEHSLSWSPDSSMLVYVSSNMIVIKDVITGEIRSLTGTGFYDEPSWSPDSSKIAYTVIPYGERSDIWIKNADGSGIASRLTSNSAAEYHPRWSPDGKLISFHSYRKKSMDIWVRNSDGSGEDRAITSDTSVDQNAEWSPDSNMLVFESKRSGNFDIWITRADGTGSPIQITNDPSDDTEPLWSPDGKKIAFLSNRFGIKGVWFKNSDGTGDDINISQGYTKVSSFDWSPDSKWIIFDSERKIIARRTDLTGEAFEVGQGLEPCWSPNGEKIAFISWEGSQYNIKIIQVPESIKKAQ